MVNPDCGGPGVGLQSGIDRRHGGFESIELIEMRAQ